MWCPSKVIGIPDLPVHGSDLVELSDGLSGKLLVVLREYLARTHSPSSRYHRPDTDGPTRPGTPISLNQGIYLKL